MRARASRVLVTIGMILVSSVAFGHYYPQNLRLENERTNLQSEVYTLETELSSLKTQLNESYNLGYEEGYVEGVEDGAGRGFNIRDPTYNEALQFISLDQTDKNEYSENYTCRYFTADFKNNAISSVNARASII